MFALFFSLYRAMFTGTWTLMSLDGVNSIMKPIANAFGEIITSLFNNVASPYSTLGDVLFQNIQGTGTLAWIGLVSYILALITCIGIVVMAVKGVKKAFGIFFGHIR